MIRMNLSLRSRLLLSFLAVIVFIGFLSTFLGIRLIHESLPRVQDVVAVDLSAAREIYRQSVSHITDAVRLIAQQQFFKEHTRRGDIDGLAATLQAIRQSEGLDILVLTDLRGEVLLRVTNPGEKSSAGAIKAIAQQVVHDRREVASTEVFSGEELAREDSGLAERARIKVVSTSYARPQPGSDASSGLVIAAAVPIEGKDGTLLGALCGGQLLNRQNAIVDRIRNSLYREEKYDGRDVCSVSIFLGDKRVATSATTDSGERAIGTLISEDVYNRVVLGGKSWINRGYVINDWYLAADEPIRNLKGQVVGILGIGLLERKFTETEQRASRMFFILTLTALLLAAAISYALLNSFMKPINTVMAAIDEIATGPTLREIKAEHAPPELIALVNAFNRMQGAIRERRRLQQEKLMRSDRLAMIGQLAAGVAHEINNPLGSILLFSRLIMQQVPPDGRVRENLERIEKETKRCHSIVQSLLDFARQREPKVESVDVNQLLDATIALFENQYIFHNIEVSRNYFKDLAPIQADRTQLQQVFMNIIINASDAMQGKGRLTIETKEGDENGQIQICISDTGCGIPPENINRIFDPFFTTKGVGHGTGLGLSVSYGIIKGHDGDITVSSAPGAGSIFTIVLPKTRESA